MAKDRLNEPLRQFLDAFANGLAVEFGEQEERARKIADFAGHTLQQELGGTGTLYIPTGHFFYVAEVHKRIYKRWQAGVAIEALAREFDVTARQVYNIIEKINGEKFKKEQQTLF